MSWTILTKIDPSQNMKKFWSFNELGDVTWGRIGTRGQSRRLDNIPSRMSGKLNEGYVIVSQNAPTPYPSSISSIMENRSIPDGVVRQSVPIRQIPTRQRIARTNRRRQPFDIPISGPATAIGSDGYYVEPHIERSSNGIKVPEFIRNHSEPQVDSYKTDAQGYIKYRTGYTRKSFDNFASTLRVVKISELVNERLQGVNTPFFKKAQEYFNRIKSDAQYNKPENFEQLRESHRPTYAVLFSVEPHNIEAVAIFGVHRGNKICDFLSLKKDTPHYTTILKMILKSIAGFVDENSKITFKIKSPTLRKEIKAIADYHTEMHGDTIIYNVRDLQSGLPDAEVKPKRWIL